MVHLAMIAMLLARSRYSITITEPLMIVLQDRTKLNTPCRTHRVIHGCTIFGDETLSCWCQRDGNQWHVRAKAGFVPVIYLYEKRLDVLAHEKAHVDDVRDRLAAFLRALTSDEFAVEDRCVRRAQEEQLTFTRRMNELRQQSNEKLD